MSKVTDDERREVAVRLRELPTDMYEVKERLELEGVYTEYADQADYFLLHLALFGCLPADFMHPYDFKELHDRLADLIEPSCDRDALLALADAMDEEVDRLGDAAQRALLPGGGPMMGRIAASRREETADGAERDACKWRAAARIVRLACGEEAEDEA